MWKYAIIIQWKWLSKGWIPWFYSNYLIYLRTLYHFDQHSGLSKVSNFMLKLRYMCAKSFIFAHHSYMDDPNCSYMNGKKLFVWRAVAKKNSGGGFRTITSNPSKLEENLISRRSVGMNGLRNPQHVICTESVLDFLIIL